MYLLHTLPEHLQEEIQIFPTTFYKRLCDVEHTIKGGMNITGMTHSEKMHVGVQKWTKNLDIFKKKVLLFPVCRSAHWFLIVVLLPELLLMQKGPAIETAETAETAVVVLNSIHGDCDDAVQNISFYLKEELLKKKGVNIEKNDLLCVVPQCPQQDDGSSCGIYLLHFAEMILSRLDFYKRVESYDDLYEWFEDDEIRRKRKKISEILLRLSNEQGHRDLADIPCISFTGPGEVENKMNLKQQQETQEIPKLLLDYINVLKKQQSDFALLRKYK